MVRRIYQTATALTSATLAFAAPAVHAETLQQALAKAYLSNPTLMAARSGQRATDENVSIAKADGRPDANVTGVYTEQLHRDPSPSFGGLTTPKRNATGQASFNVPIYQGGTVRNAINAAKKQISAGQNSLRGTEATVFSSAVTAYLDVIRDSAIVIVNRQNVHALEVNLQASSDRFQVGDLTRTDVAQSESRLALARASLQTAEAQLIASKERYIEVVGDIPSDLENPPPLPGLPESAETAMQFALSDNPDLLAAKEGIDAAHYQVKSAKGRVLPRLSAFANGSYIDYLNSERELPGGLIPGAVKSAGVGLQLAIPIYQGGRPAALARQNTALESQAMERAIEVERNVIARTRSAFARWQASMQTIESTRKAVSAGELSLEGVTAENTAGTRTVLDILDSQRDLLNAQVQYVTAQRDAYVAGFTLLAAMGHAQARDLNLDAGPLYDPAVNYKRVNGKIFDFDFDPAPKAQSTRTADLPVQNAQTLPNPLFVSDKKQ